MALGKGISKVYFSKHQQQVQNIASQLRCHIIVRKDYTSARADAQACTT